MNSTPDPADELPEADAQLIAAHDLALAALREITPAETIGAPAGHTVEADGVVSLLFENRLPGYPGWYWTVSVARVDDAEPTVLEAELLPGEGALLAPDWVPWAVRLAEYQAAQAALAEAAGERAEDADDEFDEESDEDEPEDDDLDDVDDLDDLDVADFDADGSPILHSGDVDGVDIDELDPAGADDDLDEVDDDESDEGDELDEDDGESDDDSDDEDESDSDEEPLSD
jgi:hypothetical protein